MGLSTFLYYFGGGGPLGFQDTVMTSYSCTGGFGTLIYTGPTGACNAGYVQGWTGAGGSGHYWNNQLTLPVNAEGNSVFIDPSNNLFSAAIECARPINKYLKYVAVEQGLRITGFLQPFAGLLLSPLTLEMDQTVPGDPGASLTVLEVVEQGGFPFVLTGNGPVADYRTCADVKKAAQTNIPTFPFSWFVPAGTRVTPTVSELATAVDEWIAEWAATGYAMGASFMGLDPPWPIPLVKKIQTMPAPDMIGWRIVSGGLWGDNHDRYGLRGVGTLMTDLSECCCCHDVPTPSATDVNKVVQAGSTTINIKIFSQHFYEKNDVGNFPAVNPNTIGIWLIHPASMTEAYPFIFGYTLGLSPGNMEEGTAANVWQGSCPPSVEWYTPSTPPFAAPVPPPGTPILPGGSDGTEKLYDYWDYNLDFTGKALCGPDITTGNNMSHTYLTCLGKPGRVTFPIPLQGCCAGDCDGFLQDRLPFAGTNPDPT